MRRNGTTRRRALTGAGTALAAAVLTGCSDTGGASAETAARAARAETALRGRSASTGRHLLALYDAVLDAHPEQQGLLRPLRDAVAQQVAALAGSGATRTAARPSATGAAGAPRPLAVPADPAAALHTLATAERTASDTLTSTLMDAPPQLARLLASVAAAGAAHAYLLSLGEGS